MPIFDTLVEAYAQEGYDIVAGLNQTLLQDYFLAAFTWLVRDDASVTDGLGIALSEVYFLECFGQVRPAESIFVVGNSFGWSTLVLALANPGSHVLAIDAGYDENSLPGLDLTNRLATRLGVDVVAQRGVSPQDVAAAVQEHFAAGIDLAFIDGYHGADQIVADWRAVRPFLRPGGVALFHDIVFVDLLEGYERVLHESGWHGAILHATASGMGMVADSPTPALQRLVTAFAGTPRARAVVESEANRAAPVPGHQQRLNALAELHATPPPTTPGQNQAPQ